MDDIEGIGATIHQLHMAEERERMRNQRIAALEADILTATAERDAKDVVLKAREADLKASQANEAALEAEVAELRKDAERWKKVKSASGELTLKLHNSRPNMREQIINAAMNEAQS